MPAIQNTFKATPAGQLGQGAPDPNHFILEGTTGIIERLTTGRHQSPYLVRQGELAIIECFALREGLLPDRRIRGSLRRKRSHQRIGGGNVGLDGCNPSLPLAKLLVVTVLFRLNPPTSKLQSGSLGLNAGRIDESEANPSGLRWGRGAHGWLGPASTGQAAQGDPRSQYGPRERLCPSRICPHAAPHPSLEQVQGYHPRV